MVQNPNEIFVGQFMDFFSKKLTQNKKLFKNVRGLNWGFELGPITNLSDNAPGLVSTFAHW